MSEALVVSIIVDVGPGGMVLSAPDRTFPARLSLIAMTAFSVRLMLVAQPAPVDIGDGLKVSAAGIGMMEAISPCISGRENEETFCGEPLSPEKTRALVTGVIGAGCAHFDTAQVPQPCSRTQSVVLRALLDAS